MAKVRLRHGAPTKMRQYDLPTDTALTGHGEAQRVASTTFSPEKARQDRVGSRALTPLLNATGPPNPRSFQIITSGKSL
jgi:hypothetical protein